MERALVLFLIQSAILIMACHVAVHALGHRAALRQTVLRSTLFGCITLAALAFWSTSKPATHHAPSAIRVQIPSIPPTFAVSDLTNGFTQTLESTPSSPSVPSLPAMPPLLLIWLAGVIIGCVYLAIGFVEARRLSREASRVHTEDVEALGRQFGVKRFQVLTGENIPTPFVGGIIQPKIYLPTRLNPALSTTDKTALSVVLRHEMAHISNQDLFFLLLHRVFSILLWPQLLLWTLRKPMLQTSEEVCDRIALSTGVVQTPSSEAEYAKAILALHEQFQVGRAPSIALGIIRRGSGLKRRVTALLDPKNRKPQSTRSKLTTVVFTAFLCGLVGIFIAAPGRGDAAQDGDAIQGVIYAPYSGVVRVSNPDGTPVSDGVAWLELDYGDRKGAELLKLRGSQVLIPELSGPSPVGADLVVESSRGIGWVGLWPTMKRITQIKLYRLEQLNGKLLMPSGQPARNLDVSVRLLLAPSTGKDEGSRPTLLLEQKTDSFKIQTRTDELGNYTFKKLPAGCKVRLDVNNVTVAPPVYTDDIELGTSGQTTASDLKLREAGSISGKVTLNGNPVAGLRLGAQGSRPTDIEGWGLGVTDQEGQFTIHRLLPGSYNVIVDFGYRAQPRYTAVAKQDVKVAAKANVPNQNFELIPGVVVTGTVRTMGGKPIPRAEVSFYSLAHPITTAWVQSVLADENGKYQLRVPAGEINIYLSDGTSESTVTKVDEGRANVIDLVRTKKREW